MEEKTVNRIKNVAKLVVGVGTGAIVANAVKHFVPTNSMGFLMKACVSFSVFVMGYAFAGICEEVSDDYVDSMADIVGKIRDVVEIDPDEESEVVEA